MRKYILFALLIQTNLAFAMPWERENINFLFANICNLNTNYTNTGYVTEDLYLHKFTNDFNASEARVSGYCSGVEVNNEPEGAYFFNVIIKKSHFNANGKSKYFRLLGRMFEYESESTRSFEIHLRKKSTRVVNGSIQQNLHMGVKEVIVYPYYVEESDNIVSIDEPIFYKDVKPGLIDKLEDWMQKNIKAYNILRISLDTFKWNWNQDKLLYSTKGAHSLRGYRYKLSNSNLLMNDLNLWAHVNGWYKRFSKDRATDVFLNIGSYMVYGCSYANNDDGSKDKPPIFISSDSCKSFH